MDIQLEKKKGIQKNLDYFRESCINTESRRRFTEYSRCNLRQVQ